MRSAIIVIATALATLAIVVVVLLTTSLVRETKVVTVITDEQRDGSVPYVIDRVVTGSLLRLEGGKMLRLLGVDSPEPGVECYGDESRRALELLAQPGSTAWVLPDSHDRRMGSHVSSAYIVVDGLFLNVELAGQGAVAPYFSERTGSFSDAILSAAQKAFHEKRGLWGSCPQARLTPNEPIQTGRG